MHFSAATLKFLLGTTLFQHALSTPTPAPQSVPPNGNIPAAQSNVLTGQKEGGKFVVRPAPVSQDSQSQQRRGLERRAGPIVAVLGIAGIAGAGIITKIAIEIGAETLGNIDDWNEGREKFTKDTTQAMWDRNPDYSKFPAAICYNKGYRIKDPSLVDGLVSAKYELGLLNTDYDCMFMGAPNQFFTDSDGGFINLSYTYDPTRCSFDGSTGDLTCN